MWHCFEADASFLQFLVVIDDDTAEQVRRAGCARCGGPLRSGDYPRKPRGLLAEAEEAYSKRRSLCCGWCRKRTTPPSVRFLGRKVYVGWLVFVAVIHWILGVRTNSVVATVPPRTVRRWRRWWTTDFVALPFWQRAKALFMPPPVPLSLPLGLVERFAGDEPERLRQAPVTTISASWVRVAPIHAEVGI